MATFLTILAYFGLLLMVDSIFFYFLSKNWYRADAFCEYCGREYEKVLMRHVGGEFYICTSCDESQMVAEVITEAILDGAVFEQPHRVKERDLAFL